MNSGAGPTKALHAQYQGNKPGRLGRQISWLSRLDHGFDSAGPLETCLISLGGWGSRSRRREAEMTIELDGDEM